MISLKLVYASIALIGTAAAIPLSKSYGISNTEKNQKTLRQVTLLMRHGERAPVDTYPKDPYINSTMDPYGWGQLTDKGRLNVYNIGLYLRDRYGEFLGENYSPDKFWLQSTSADRAKMTAMILSAALWKPSEKQKFKSEIDWQPVALHYWTRPEDQLLIIWNACPKLTVERLKVDDDPIVRRINIKFKDMYDYIEKNSGWPMNNPGDVANIYSTLNAEEAMGLPMPEWIRQYYPTKMSSLMSFSLSQNVFNDKLRRLAGGPFISKMVRKMEDRVTGNLKPKARKMFAYIAHDNSVVNLLSSMRVWDGKEPGFNAMVLIELHEIKGDWNVQLFYRNAPDYEIRPLIIPGCQQICPLKKFKELMEPMIIDDYETECKVDDPNYKIPPPPPA
ncbi:venom acid phosphatase Acph-1 isoform X1 [Microplitis demolitor]|uniref:venom acid phosphatase Acph-1 isoform X1 n=1 Tax=Microplitis demolitor TaxID=69319 RepID=UPI0004CD95B1|nr:venom acid phosphatase Acph-1 isoform X1 [Microplitis demolitor]